MVVADELLYFQASVPSIINSTRYWIVLLTIRFIGNIEKLPCVAVELPTDSNWDGAMVTLNSVNAILSFIDNKRGVIIKSFSGNDVSVNVNVFQHVQGLGKMHYQLTDRKV